MKTKHDIRALLGATQVEMAMLLKITRAQWSMYESGKRNLPSHALVLLSQLLKPLEASPKNTEKHPLAALQESNLKTELTQLIKENQYQIQATAKKLEAVELKYALSVKALQFADHFGSTSQTKAEVNKDILKTIENRAAVSIKQTGLSEIVKLKIKLQLLQNEEELLKEALK